MNRLNTPRHRWHCLGNATGNAVKSLVGMVLLVAFVSVAPANENTESLRVYFIGNSVTDTIRYESFAKLAESRDQSIVWGRHMIPGAPLEWIHSHADSGFMQEPFGHYPKALGDFVWDAVSVQPFDRHLHSNDVDGDRGDVAMISDFAERAAKQNPNVQLYIYARWPRITSQGKGADFDKNDFDPTTPGSGADLSKADKYADRWTAEYTGGWDATNESRDYFNQLLLEVRKATPFLNKPPMLVPVGEVMFELDRRMQDGKIPGYNSIYQLYKDAIHLGELGSFVVGCTYYATLMKQSPVGLPTEPFGKLDAKTAAIVQQVVWDVVREHRDAGVIATKFEPPSQSAMKLAAEYSQSYRGQAMLVMHDGQMIFEQYDDRGGPTNKQMLASGSKSFVGIVAAAAVEDKLIGLDDPVAENLPEWQDDSLKSKITYRQLLTLTSGLTAGERGAAVRAPAWSDIASKPMNGEPGKQFQYGAYQLNTFAYAIETKLGDESFESYLKRRILDLLDIELEWRFRCADGHPQVGGGGFMTARDWAKFGELVRLGGRWGDKQLIDAELISDCFVGTQSNPAYGQTWWLKKTVTSDLQRTIPILSSEWGDVANSDWLPNDLIAACGAGKQRLYIIPSMQLTIVRQGSIGRGFSDIEFLSRLLNHKSE